MASVCVACNRQAESMMTSPLGNVCSGECFVALPLAEPIGAPLDAGLLARWRNVTEGHHRLRSQMRHQCREIRQHVRDQLDELDGFEDMPLEQQRRVIQSFLASREQLGRKVPELLRTCEGIASSGQKADELQRQRTAQQQSIGPLIETAGAKRPSEQPLPPASRTRMGESYGQIAATLATYGDGVTLAPSGIAGAGLGLFATRSFEVGEPITAYTGKEVLHAQARNMGVDEVSHMRAKFLLTVAIDGKYLRDGTLITDPASQLAGLGVAAYANDARGSLEFYNNAKFDHVDTPATAQMLEYRQYKRLEKEGERIVFLRATERIEPGDEIFTDYGDRYWEKIEEAAQERAESAADPDIAALERQVATGAKVSTPE